MAITIRVFKVPSRLSFADLTRLLHERYRVQASQRRTVHRTFLDSFDWRVHGAGRVLEEQRCGAHASMCWRMLGCEEPVLRADVDVRPKFAADLPPGPLRDQLAALLKMRALLPRSLVRSTGAGLRLLNADGKTVVRMTLETHHTKGEHGHRARRLGSRLLVIPVRGYRKTLRHVLQYIRGTLALDAITIDLAEETYAALGTTPSPAGASGALVLDPARRADESIKGLLLELLEPMACNIEGVKADIDTECLHEFRVAVRRTRSLLSRVKSVLPHPVIKRFRGQFGWLGEVSGPLRDMDVYLLGFDGFLARLPPERRADLDPLRTFLEVRQADERRYLLKALNSVRFRRVMDSWERFLRSPPPQRTTLVHARTPVIEFAGAGIWKTYRRVIRDGRRIGAHTPDRYLHELRKTCKILRYLFEFFHTLYDQDDVHSAIRTLKRLQDNLGQIQDLSVQAQTLLAFSDEVTLGSTDTGGIHAAMEALASDMQRQQKKARRRFSSRFGAFDAPTNRRLLKNMLAARTRR